MKILLFALCLLALPRAAAPQSSYASLVAERLQLYGHRNWVVIADSAYPAQSRDGIETVVSNADQVSVLRHVLGLIGNSRHVRPIIYTDQELAYVPEAEAPGISQYRRDLGLILSGQQPATLPHEQIISKLDDAGRTFRVLIIKTNLALPYTSVFIQLDCAYWGADSEKRLREAIAAGKPPDQ